MFGKKEKKTVKKNGKTKPLLTRLLLSLIDENSRYDAILRVFDAEILSAEKRGLNYIETNRLREILRCSGYEEMEKEEIPSYEEFIEEYISYENEA